MMAELRWAVGIDPTAPGQVLREALKLRGMTQTDLAQRMGRPVQMVNEVVNGKKVITAETALQLERALGISADFWVQFEAQYRLALARRNGGGGDTDG